MPVYEFNDEDRQALKQIQMQKGLQSSSMAQKQSPQQPAPSGIGAVIDPLYNALMAAGSGANKVLTNAANSTVGNLMGNPQMFKPGMELHHPGISADIGEFAGSAVPYLAGLEVLGPMNAAGNIASSAIYGASQNPEDVGHGAKTGAAWGLLGEAPSLIGKGISKAAEFVNPVKSANMATKDIRNHYQALKKEISENNFKPVEREVGDIRITDNNENNAFTSIKKSMFEKYLSPDAEEMVEKFVKDPKFKDAHKLQSQIGAEIRGYEKIKEKTPVINGHIQKLKGIQNKLLSQMDSFLSGNNPELADLYREGRARYAQELIPFKKNASVANMAHGFKTESSPNKLISSLTNLKESGKLPKGHYLEGVLGDISGKVGQGKTAVNAASLLSGALGAKVAGPYGALGAGAASQFLGPKALSMAQDPRFIELLQQLSPHGDLARKVMISQGAKQ